jgi:hypothetical protein
MPIRACPGEFGLEPGASCFPLDGKVKTTAAGKEERKPLFRKRQTGEGWVRSLVVVFLATPCPDLLLQANKSLL